MNAPKPDMAKVREAVERYSNRPKASGSRTYPPQPSPIAQDAAIRKPLTAHGVICRSGFMHPDFLNLQ